MPAFSYRALDPAGRTVRGELEAIDRRNAAQKLNARGIRPLAIEQHQGEVNASVATETLDLYPPEGRSSLLRLQKSKSTQALQFAKRLHVLLSAGMAIGEAVRLMGQRVADVQQQALAEGVWKQLSEGNTLAGALRAESKHLFSDSALYLIEAGEASGNLQNVLARIIAYLEETQTVRRNLMSKLSYPLLVLGVAFLVVIVLITFLLPRIEAMLAQLGGELPWITVLLLEGSHAAKTFGPFLLIAVAVGAIALWRWRATDIGRSRTDLWLLRVPMLGRIVLYASLYGTSNLMATLLGSGVNTTEALRLVERTLGNSVLRQKFAVARRQIQEGTSMTSAFEHVHFLPELAIDILSVGENTGNVVTSLEDIHRIYREELTRLLNTMTTLVVGIALGSAIFLVGTIAASVVLSVLSVNQSLQI